RTRTRAGLVTMSREGTRVRPRATTIEDDAKPEVVVAASGNLANVYFTLDDGRMTLEAIGAEYPGLVDALTNHPGIGFAMVRSESGESLVVGRDGLRRFGTDDGAAPGSVEGSDPLAPYGPHALDGLRRLDSFAECGDLVLV